MRPLLSRSVLPEVALLEWRLSILIVMAALSSVFQGCGIISDGMSTSVVSPSTGNLAAEKTEPHAFPPKIPPVAKLPPSPEPDQFPPIAKIPAPTESTTVETGLASWYGPGFHGKLTASGEVFNQEKFTAAHRTLPWGSRVKVTNLANGKSVNVRINDRGPFGKGRVIDVSRAAARVLGIVGSGIATVRVESLSDSHKSNELVLQDK
jgi:rare lipoprotein A